MKRLKDVPDRIVLKATSTGGKQQRSHENSTPGQMKITSRSSKEVLDNIPLTIYTQRAKR